MNYIPEQTIAFRIYANGSDLLGVASVELPELSNLTETVSGTGVLGEYESPAMGAFVFHERNAQMDQSNGKGFYHAQSFCAAHARVQRLAAAG